MVNLMFLSFVKICDLTLLHFPDDGQLHKWCRPRGVCRHTGRRGTIRKSKSCYLVLVYASEKIPLDTKYWGLNRDIDTSPRVERGGGVSF